MIFIFNMSLPSSDVEQESKKTSSSIQDEQIESLIAGITDPISYTGAMEQLYQLIRVPVYSFALSLVKNPYDAEDILHDTLLSVCHAAPNYQPNGKPMAWIITIARNHAYNRLRQQKHLADIPDDSLDTYLQDNQTVTPEDRIVLEQCLTALSDTERQIVVMHAVSGIKHRQIAEILSLPLPTVLSKYNRALKKLRKKLLVSQK